MENNKKKGKLFENTPKKFFLMPKNCLQTFKIFCDWHLRVCLYYLSLFGKKNRTANQLKQTPSKIE